MISSSVDYGGWTRFLGPLTQPNSGGKMIVPEIRKGPVQILTHQGLAGAALLHEAALTTQMALTILFSECF